MHERLALVGPLRNLDHLPLVGILPDGSDMQFAQLDVDVDVERIGIIQLVNYKSLAKLCG